MKSERKITGVLILLLGSLLAHAARAEESCADPALARLLGTVRERHDRVHKQLEAGAKEEKAIDARFHRDIYLEPLAGFGSSLLVGLPLGAVAGQLYLKGFKAPDARSVWYTVLVTIAGNWIAYQDGTNKFHVNFDVFQNELSNADFMENGNSPRLMEGLGRGDLAASVNGFLNLYDEQDQRIESSYRMRFGDYGKSLWKLTFTGGDIWKRNAVDALRLRYELPRFRKRREVLSQAEFVILNRCRHLAQTSSAVTLNEKKQSEKSPASVSSHGRNAQAPGANRPL